MVYAKLVPKNAKYDQKEDKTTSALTSWSLMECYFYMLSRLVCREAQDRHGRLVQQDKL